MSGVALRPLMPEDAPAAHALVERTLHGTRYRARAVEQLDAALQFDDPEYLAVLAMHDDAVAALTIFGTVAGASRCSKLHLLVGEADLLGELAAGIVQLCASAGERLLVCELADDALLADASSALLGSGFVEEGRAPDYVVDGVDLRLLVWRA